MRASFRVIAIALALATTACRKSDPELPVLGTVPHFTLVDARGAPFGERDLDGHVVVADFIFTRCTTACPMLTSQMANFQRRLGERAPRVRFVSFSVDPTYDTPDVLREYAAEHGAAGDWIFATGDVDAVKANAVRGFRVGIGERTEGSDGAFDIMHARYFVLLDRQRRIRGFFRTDEESLEALERAIDALLDER